MAIAVVGTETFSIGATGSQALTIPSGCIGFVVGISVHYASNLVATSANIGGVSLTVEAKHTDNVVGVQMLHVSDISARTDDTLDLVFTASGTYRLTVTYFSGASMAVEQYGYSTSGCTDVVRSLTVPTLSSDGTFIAVVCEENYNRLINNIVPSAGSTIIYNGAVAAQQGAGGHTAVLSATTNVGVNITCGAPIINVSASVAVYDTNISVTPAPIVATVTIPAPVETGVNDVNVYPDDIIRAVVTLPAPTVTVTHPRVLPLVGEHMEMSGRVAASAGLTTPMLSEVGGVPLWVEATAAAPTHASTTGQTASDHHAKYLDSEAIAAVEGEATLALAGTVAIAKKLGLSSFDTLSATGHNNDLDTTDKSLYFWTGDGDYNVTGIVADAQGTLLLFYNADATQTVTLMDEDAASTAANRFDLGGSDLALLPDESALLVYHADGARWFVIAKNAAGGGGGSALTVTDESGTVIDTAVTSITVPDGTLVDDGVGLVTLREVPTGAIYARRERSADVTMVVTTAAQIIPFDTVTHDSDGMTGTASIFTIQNAGWYQVNLNVYTTGIASGQFDLKIYRNSTGQAFVRETGPTGVDLKAVSASFWCDVGDTISGYITSTVDTSFVVKAWSPTLATAMSVFKVGSGNVAGLDTDRATRASTSLTLNSTTWADVDNTMDLSVLAQVGDILNVSAYGRWGNEAVWVGLDAVTQVAGADTNHISGAGGTGYGVTGWGAESSVYGYMGATQQYVVVAGDIENGAVALRLRYKGNAATNKTLEALAGYPFHWSVVNLRGGAVSPTAPLGVTVYAPATQVVKTATTSFGDVDATNLVVSFTAPASGNVIVWLSALADNSAGGGYHWNLRDSGGDVSGTIVAVTRDSNGEMITSPIYVTGLTPYVSYTWKWGFRGATGSTCRIIAADGDVATEVGGPASMFVMSA